MNDETYKALIKKSLEDYTLTIEYHEQGLKSAREQIDRLTQILERYQ